MSTHIAAQRGEIASRVLMPGDPLRAKYIAEKFFVILLSLVTNTVCAPALRALGIVIAVLAFFVYV